MGETDHEGAARAESLLDEVARGASSPMQIARQLGDVAATVGFDWERPEQALDKVREEVEEVAQALAEGEREAIEGELGDLLFAACMVARKAGVDAEAALRRTNDKFRARFAAIERELKARGVALGEASLEQMEQAWQRAKGGDGA